MTKRTCSVCGEYGHTRRAHPVVRCARCGLPVNDHAWENHTIEIAEAPQA